MANCGDQGCNCLVRPGAGIEISGAGTAASPYVIGLSGDISGTFFVQDTETVDLQLSGTGTPTDPYLLLATATVKMTQLADVNDPQGGPNVGDVPVWVGGVGGHFEFQPPPTAPAGAVNVGTGIIGDGSVGAPIRVRMIGSSFGGATTGLEVYADSAGNLRAVPPGAASVDWANITNKPSVFPTNDANFSGILSVAKGGTGANSLASITVGNSSKVDGHQIFVQSATPTGMVTNDLWFWG